MSRSVEFTDFEWVKHRPSWGEIPMARSNHFAWVFEKKMFIMGGETAGAPPDGNLAVDIPYLDLTSWTWGRQKLTGSAPTTGFLRANCFYDEEKKAVKVTLGPRWEAGSNQVIDIYTLDMETLVWAHVTPRGRWSPSWKMEGTVVLSKSQKVVQVGRHTLSNFSDQLVSGIMYYNTSTAWSTFYELPKAEKDATPLAVVPFGSDKLLVVWYDTNTNITTATTFDGTSAAKIVCSAQIQRVGSESLSTLVIGDQLLLFDNLTLSQDRVASLKVGELSGTVPTDVRHIKSTLRAPQKPRVGVSAVHYDGYIIFFGGALSRELGAKLTNDLHVLSVGSHNSIESVLDDLAFADAAMSELEKEEEKPEEDAPVELEDKPKKKKHNKKVGFQDDAEATANATASSAASSSSSTSAVDATPSANGEEKPKEKDEEKSSSTDSTSSKDSVVNKEKEEAVVVVAVDDPLTKLLESPAKPVVAPVVEKAPLTNEEKVLKYLDDNQGNFTKLLSLAVNNPDCYPDMAFKVNGKLFWTHKAIICARSSRWRGHLEPAKTSKHSSPSSGRRSSDLEDSQLDVSGESAIPKETSRASPFMFGRLGASAIDLMLDEEDDTKPKFEMVQLPPRYSESATHPALLDRNAWDVTTGVPNPPGAPKSPAVPVASSSGSIASPSSSNDSIQSSASSSGIAPPAKSVPAYTLYDMQTEAFAKVLAYMYTGAITVTPSDAEAISDVAHEFLLDEVSTASRSKSTQTVSEPPMKISRMLRRLVGSPSGSDYFFVVRQKKLFAHRFAIFLFSAHFRKIMLSRQEKSYMEVKEISEWDLPVETFIDFCRMLYSNFTTLPEHAEKKMDVANLSRLATAWAEFRCLSLVRSSKPDAKSTLEMYRMAANTPILMRDVRRSILLHFGKFGQDKSVVKSLSKSEQLEWLHLGELGGATWLDKMWFAHSTGNTKLSTTAEAALGSLINVENVLPILFCAHQIGFKELRSLCMDFMSAHSTSIEDAQRMQVDAPVALGKVSSLSASVNHELTTKLSSATSSASVPKQKVKSCDFCNKTFSTFGKKNTCALCHKTACGDCTRKKITIPPIFGFSKPRDICLSCAQVVDIWSEPTKQQASSSSTTTTTTNTTAKKN